MRGKDDIEQLVVRLHRDQLELRPSDFLQMHLTNRTIIKRHVDAFRRYAPYLRGGNILDWGCRHAIDACLIKNHFGAEARLFGCDVMDEGYEVFFQFADLEFSMLDHPNELPYGDDTFDAVVGSGVLEHVPNDVESVREIRRVLKPGGNLIITFLPNRYSYVECLSKVLGRPHHDRLYSMGSVRQLLSQSGLAPVYSAYHQVMPTLAGGASAKIGRIRVINRLVQFLYRFNGFFEELWPTRWAATNIMVVAQKAP